MTTISWIILDSFERSGNCYPFNLVGILMNISAYLKNLGKLPCCKLFELLLLFTNYTFLLQSQHNPQCLIKLLHVFDNIVSFENQENIVFLVELWKRKHHLERIDKLSFSDDTIQFFFKQIMATNKAYQLAMLNEEDEIQLKLL